MIGSNCLNFTTSKGNERSKYTMLISKNTVDAADMGVTCYILVAGLVRCYVVYGFRYGKRNCSKLIPNQNRYTKFLSKTSGGFIVAGMVFTWIWAGTLLQSSTVAYEYSVAGSF